MRAWTGLAVFAFWSCLAASAAAQGALDQLEAQLREQAGGIPLPARPEPGYLGAVTDDQRPQPGVHLTEVQPGGPAAQAGLRAGDLILSVNGKPVRKLDDMAQFITGSAAGTRLELRIDRNGRALTVPVTLGTRPLPVEPEFVLPPGQVAPPLEEQLLGVRTAPLAERDRRRTGVPVPRGALVVSVLVSSPAARAGVPIDAVIVGVDNRSIESPAQLAERLHTLGPGKVVELAYYVGDQLARQRFRLASDPAALERRIEQLEQQLFLLHNRVQELERRLPTAPE